MDVNQTLERIYPDESSGADPVEQEAIELHLARYRFAAEHAVGRHLLDITSGSGYGTAILGQAHPDTSCLGIDRDPAAIAYAGAHYPMPNVTYLQADAMSYGPGQKFDTIVSLETIEHLPDPGGFIRRLMEMLNVGGIIIASVPITPSKDGNPYHLHDFTERSFTAHFLRNGLAPLVPRLYQVQTYYNFSSFFSKRTKQRTRDVPRNLLKYYLRHPTALALRIGAICRFGFTNRYLTAVFQRNGSSA